MENKMIWMQVRTLHLDERITYCADCWFDNNKNKFTYYAVAHETKAGFVKRIVNSIRHEFNIKPEVI